MSTPVSSNPATSGSNHAHLDAAAAERRVQPRHSHFGPNPPPASNGGDAPADADGPPPAAMLYRHALECIFAFLGQTELAAALQVSRGWLAAVKAMASLQLEVSRLSSPVCDIAQSAMGRHVGALGHPEEPVALIVDSLHVLALKMPLLRKLACELALPPLQAPLTFPAALRELDLDLSVSDHAVAADINAAIDTISRLPLLESLAITVPVLDAQLSFAPLVALPQLRALTIGRLYGQWEISDAQLHQLRSLPRLRSLHVTPVPIDAMRRLLRQPHDLQWQHIGVFGGLRDETAALLPLLPSLTRINARLGCERFDWLRGLPNLTDVDFEFFRREVADDEDRAASLVAASLVAASLVAGLQGCANIEILLLEECAGLTSAHLAELLPRLPRLRELVLDNLRIDSLSFLAQPPMTDQLTTLHLNYCRQLPPAELRHVHSLRSLERLQLYRSFPAPLDEFSLSLLTPPSLLLPRLDKFLYTGLW